MSAQAQKEGAIWYFGQHAGLDFTRHYPRPLTDGKIYTREGVASISDSIGNLLFYTDGTTVWNKNHQVMDNGSGLFGNTSSTQSSIIVPTPHRDHEYYIFTVDVVEDGDQPGKGLNYTVVDMVQNNRIGRVTTKNSPLLPVCVEKITAVRHENGDDYWIIAHGWNSSLFYVYKLTRSGVSQAGSGIYQQDVGSVHRNASDDDGFNRGAVGYMKASPKGDYLALAIESQRIFELFSFHPATGKITFLATLPAGTEADPNASEYAAYGVEFSPTSNYLYGSTRQGGKLYRWDISKPSETAIRQSLEILNPEMQNITCGALQLAFNGKIYICFAGKQYLGVINSPTQDDCYFVQMGASLIDNVAGEGGQAYYGLPTFLPDFFRAAEFYYENTCQNDRTLFYLSTVYGVSSPPVWSVYNEDGTNYIGRVTTDPETYEGIYQFTEAGTYIVELQVNQSGNMIKQKREVIIHSLPELDFRDTTILCAGGSVPLDAGDGAFYRWSDNVNLLERIREIRSPGTYSVEVTHNNGCIKKDTTEVVQKPLPVIKEIITSKASCGHNNGTIKVIPEGDLNDYTFVWKEFPDSAGNTLTNLERGVYEVDVISKETGCPKNAKITISETGAPDITIRPSTDSTLCPGSEITLTAEGAAHYLWTLPEGDTTASVTLRPYETETYVVEGYATDNQGRRCFALKEITIEVYPWDPPQLGQDLSLCDGEEKTLDGLERFVSWNWSNGETGRYVTLTETVNDLVLITTDEHGCVSGDTINVEFKPLPEIDLGADRTLCKGEDISLDAGPADAWMWNTGDTTQQIPVPSSGTYSVLVTLDGCSASDDVIIRINDPDSLRVDSVQTSAVTCYGDQDGSMRIFVRGEGSFYEYSLDEGMTWEDNSGFFTGLPRGLHEIWVREDSACQTVWPDPVEITEPEELIIEYRLISPACTECTDGQITLKLSGGIPPYDILWSNFETGRTRNNLTIGQHSVAVTDSKNCKTLVTIPLEMGHGALSIPNAFTPNQDQINDVWEVRSLADYPECIVRIFDQTGRQVFESDPGYPQPWDGRLTNGEFLPRGTYYYVINLNSSSEPLNLVTGSITLIR